MPSEPSLYQIFDVPETATTKEIEDKYIYHCQKYAERINADTDGSVTEAMQVLLGIFDVLKDERQRLFYDRFGIVSKPSELSEPVWAIVDGKRCLAADLTYHEATEKLAADPAGTIVTAATASRISLA